jgi:hypothetical protein
MSRPSDKYADLRACPHCGALAEILGGYDRGYVEPTLGERVFRFIPAPIVALERKHPIVWGGTVISTQTSREGNPVHQHIVTHQCTGDILTCNRGAPALAEWQTVPFEGELPVWATNDAGASEDEIAAIKAQMAGWKPKREEAKPKEQATSLFG